MLCLVYRIYKGKVTPTHLAVVGGCWSQHRICPNKDKYLLMIYNKAKELQMRDLH